MTGPENSLRLVALAARLRLNVGLGWTIFENVDISAVCGAIYTKFGLRARPGNLPFVLGLRIAGNAVKEVALHYSR